jgi:methylthioribulose-1-phosphate dehydratase
MPPALPVLAEAVAGLIEAGAGFHRRGWMLGTSGNLSAVVSRDPLRLAITASGVDKGALAADQVLVVGEDGQVVEGGTGRASDETSLHLALVQGTGAAAVLHTHSVWGTLLSDAHAAAGGLAIEGYEMLKGLAGVRTHAHREWVPVLENTQDYGVLAGEIRATLERAPQVHGILLRRHGLYTWGRDLLEARRHVEILEFLFEVRGRVPGAASAGEG